MNSLPLNRLSVIPLSWIPATIAMAMIPSIAGRVGVIAVASWVCMRLGPRCRDLLEALLVGAVWVCLDVGAEAVTSAATGREWHQLIGPNAVLLAAWFVGPLVFARRE